MLKNLGIFTKILKWLLPKMLDLWLLSKPKVDNGGVLCHQNGTLPHTVADFLFSSWPSPPFPIGLPFPFKLSFFLSWLYFILPVLPQFFFAGCGREHVKFHDLVFSSTIMIQIKFPFMKTQRQNKSKSEENNVKKMFCGFIWFELKGIDLLARIKCTQQIYNEMKQSKTMPGRSFWAKQVVRRRNGKCAIKSVEHLPLFFGNCVQADLCSLPHVWSFAVGF